MKIRFSIPREIHRKAFAIAQIHLSRFHHRIDFRNAAIQIIYPLLDPSGKEGVFFEAKFSSPEKPDNGFAIISVSKNYLPIIMFTFEGITIIEGLRKKIGHRNFNTVFYSPSYIVAEDFDGKILESYGHRPPVMCTRKDLSPKHFRGLDEYGSFKKCFLLQREIYLKKTKGTFKNSWKLIDEILSQGASSGQPSDYPSDSSSLPPHNYEEILADHFESIPHYDQIDPNVGANQDHDFHSGCGATAWMGLVGYYDNSITPDLLRGTHWAIGPDSNSYQDHIMVSLSEALGTQEDGDEGKVRFNHMHRGFGFIKGTLNHPIEDEEYDEGASSIETLQKVYDNLCFYGVPSIVALPDHFVVAYGALMNLDGADEEYFTTSDHYLKVNWGWGPSNSDVYIPYELANNGYWTLRRINSISEVNTGITTTIYNTKPIFVDLGSRILMGLRTDHEKISFYRSDNGQDFTLSFEIPSNGKSAPSFALEPGGKYLYIAWNQSDNSLSLAKLAIYSNHEGPLKILKAPPDDTPTSGPAIAVHKGKLYYVWGGYIAYTPVDWFERYGNVWPEECFHSRVVDGQESRWLIWDMYGNFGSPGSITDPCLISDGINLYLGTNRNVDNKEYTVTMLDDSGNIKFGATGLMMECESGPNLCYYRNFIYSCSEGTICYLTFSSRPVPGRPFIQELTSLNSTETLWPYEVDYRAVTLGSSQRFDVNSGHGTGNLGPCLFSGWIEDYTVRIRYHSIEHGTPLDYTGWII